METLYKIFIFLVGLAVGIASYGSYQAHTANYQMATQTPETITEYVYIEKEPEIITETIIVEVEKPFYRELSEEDCYYLMDLAMRESEGEGVMGLLWVMYTAECRKKAFGYDSYKSVWASDAFASSWDRRGLEPNDDCKEALALFEEGWVPEPLWFQTGDYHGFGTPLFQYGNHYFSTQ